MGWAKKSWKQKGKMKKFPKKIGKKWQKTGKIKKAEGARLHESGSPLHGLKSP